MEKQFSRVWKRHSTLTLAMLHVSLSGGRFDHERLFDFTASKHFLIPVKFHPFRNYTRSPSISINSKRLDISKNPSRHIKRKQSHCEPFRCSRVFPDNFKMLMMEKATGWKYLITKRKVTLSYLISSFTLKEPRLRTEKQFSHPHNLSWPAISFVFSGGLKWQQMFSLFFF